MGFHACSSFRENTGTQKKSKEYFLALTGIIWHQCSSELSVCMYVTKARPEANSAYLQSYKPHLQATRDKDTFYRAFISPALPNSQKHSPPSSPTYLHPSSIFTFYSSIVSSFYLFTHFCNSLFLLISFSPPLDLN